MEKPLFDIKALSAIKPAKIGGGGGVWNPSYSRLSCPQFRGATVDVLAGKIPGGIGVVVKKTPDGGFKVHKDGYIRCAALAPLLGDKKVQLTVEEDGNALKMVLPKSKA